MGDVGNMDQSDPKMHGSAKTYSSHFTWAVPLKPKPSPSQEVKCQNSVSKGPGLVQKSAVQPDPQTIAPHTYSSSTTARGPQGIVSSETR